MSPFSNFFPMGDGVNDLAKAQGPWTSVAAIQFDLRFESDSKSHGGYF